MKKPIIPGGGSRTILLSKRANIFYLDRVKVYVRNERVIYQIVEQDSALDYNLPDCNTAMVLLGKGSSITDAAIRSLAKSGVVVGFAGSGGAPAHALMDFVFLNPADEYRPTEYCQAWVELWQDPNRKLKAARALQAGRVSHVQKAFSASPRLVSEGVGPPQVEATTFLQAIAASKSEKDLLLAEALWTKALYRMLAVGLRVNDFSRQPGEGIDTINRLLDHGNYLLYGLATVALHALGIPPAFALIHGKTRRGALVFDVADLFKDAYVLPRAFDWGTKEFKGKREQGFRADLIDACQKDEVLDKMIETIKALIKT